MRVREKRYFIYHPPILVDAIAAKPPGKVA